ncbi:conserved hypothetical protein [Burkholderia sp. 8Y]|nr:conserved hypothetical protein [Burkholderia sp. 8Y]
MGSYISSNTRRAASFKLAWRKRPWWGVQEKRSYPYRKFTIVVETDCVVPRSGTANLSSPDGFVALVHITTAEGAPLTAPLRLSAVGEHPFASEADALMSGHSAGQQLIEDLADGQQIA